jgi:hypothetical protein
MGSRQEGVLLQDNGPRLRNDAAPCTGDHILALRLRCRLPRVHALLGQAVVSGKVGVVLPAREQGLPEPNRLIGKARTSTDGPRMQCWRQMDHA